jgi:hypothetical protein
LKSETVVGGFASTFSFLIKTIYPCQSWEDLSHSRGGGRPISIRISLPFLGWNQDRNASEVWIWAAMAPRKKFYVENARIG